MVAEARHPVKAGEEQNAPELPCASLAGRGCDPRPSKELTHMRNGICELLGIEHPVIQAGMSLFTSGELVCAVSNAGGLGSLGCWRRPIEDFRRQISVIKERTTKPFAINHVVPDLKDEVLAATLPARPALV